MKLLSALAVGLMLAGPLLAQDVRYFILPHEIQPYGIAIKEEFRTVGRVRGDVSYDLQQTAKLNISDGAVFLDVEYAGQLPDLFQEASLVAVHGHLDERLVFVANEILIISEDTVGEYIPDGAVDELRELGLIDF